MPQIPYDMYENNQEFLIIIPFGGVDKKSIEIHMQYDMMTISGQRKKPLSHKGYFILQELAYRGQIKLEIALPPEANYEAITSHLSPENILIIKLPKIIIPNQIPVHIEEESDT